MENTSDCALQAELKNEQVQEYLDRYFKYHPVRTDARQRKHNEVNAAAREFARVVLEYGLNLNHSEYLTQIQFTRMMLNQCITVKELDELEEQASTLGL